VIATILITRIRIPAISRASICLAVPERLLDQTLKETWLIAVVASTYVLVILRSAMIDLCRTGERSFVTSSPWYRITGTFAYTSAHIVSEAI
jgi:hypothetical protein